MLHLRNYFPGIDNVTKSVTLFIEKNATVTTTTTIKTKKIRHKSPELLMVAPSQIDFVSRTISAEQPQQKLKKRRHKSQELIMVAPTR